MMVWHDDDDDDDDDVEKGTKGEGKGPNVVGEKMRPVCIIGPKGEKGCWRKLGLLENLKYAISCHKTSAFSEHRCHAISKFIIAT